MSYEVPNTLSEFYDRAEAGVDPDEQEAFGHFRQQAEARHARGEDIFGDAYLRRNNPAEGCEEGADGGNYACYDHLRYRADHGEEEDPALVHLLTAALHFFKAHLALREAAGKRLGSP